MSRDLVRVHGRIEVVEREAATGRILTHYRGRNRVVDTGVTLIAERLRGNTEVSGISDYALGTNNTPPTAGQTALLAEAYRGLVTQTRVSGGELKITLHLGSTQGNGVTYQEGGAFNSENSMLCRAVFPPKAKTNLKELSIIHTIPFTAS